MLSKHLMTLPINNPPQQTVGTSLTEWILRKHLKIITRANIGGHQLKKKKTCDYKQVLQEPLHEDDSP